MNAENKNMFSPSSLVINRRNSKITGVFFIAATVFAILGLSLYDPLLNDSNYLIIGKNNSIQIVFQPINRTNCLEDKQKFGTLRAVF